MFNTLKYVKIMEESGFSRTQAETSVNVLAEVMETQLATRQDMIDLRRDINDLRNAIRAEMKHDMVVLKSDLTVRLGGMMLAGFTVMTAIIKLV